MNELGLGPAFSRVSRDVDAGGFVVLHADSHRPVERGVGLAVNPAVERIPSGHARGGRNESRHA
jgi:hypothetical protein